MGPTLFVAFIDPLLRSFSVHFPDLRLQAYADDSGLLCPVKTLCEITPIVQPAIDFISEWVASAGLDFNISKSHAVIFRYGHGTLPSHPDLFVRGIKIDFCNEVRYLGVLFSQDMKFSHHISEITKKCNIMLGALRRKIGNHAPSSILGTVYDACIRSVLEYGAVVWDPILKGDIAELERTQFYALRLFLNDFTVSYVDGLERAGWSFLSDRRKRMKLNQFFKYYHGLHDFCNKRFIHKTDFRTSDRTCQAHHLVVPRHYFEAYKQCFIFSCTTIWNSLPSDVALSKLQHFRSTMSCMCF